MAVLLSLEERKRKSRNIVLAAFILLIVIWSLKLAFPQHTIISVYTTHYPPAPSTIPSKPIVKPKPAGDNKWKSKPSENPSLSDSFNGTVGEKAAIIIETRFRSNLIPLILHFGSVLGPTWPIIIYTSAESVGLFSASAALGRYLRSGAVQIRILPQTVLFTDSASVDAFMTKPWLWENLAPVEHVLIFQSDSMLCANAARSVDDYFEYDFVGASIVMPGGKAMTGGLSLRKTSTVLRVLESWDWEESRKVDGNKREAEDQWFCNKMKELQAEEEGQGIDPQEEGAVNLPTMEVARTFSVESIDYPHPLGVHSVHKWSKEQTPALDEWCPEYKLSSFGGKPAK